LIHTYWLEKHGIDGIYTKHAIRPDDVISFLRGMREAQLAGCNVTIPYKEAAYAAADEKKQAARVAGSANTLWHENGKLVADNTDGFGFMSHLGETLPSFDPRGRTVAVLGAGGSGRGIVHAFLEAGVAEVRLFNRTRARADQVAQHLGPRVKPYNWDQRVDRTQDVCALVNATSLGMQGGTPLDMHVSQLDPECVVADIVYVPLETRLIMAARMRSLRVVDGLGMLLYQAVPGFEKWFGVRPSVTRELRELVLADLGES
jgi:shikimate dehydrogenase